MESNARARVIISGRVQGVFFRAETQRAAQQLGLTGWVRNRPEGTVEAIFEGPRAGVERAVTWCWGGSASARVNHVDVSWQEPTGEFDGFFIRR